MNSIDEQIKNSILEWQKRFEEMRVQFNLGKMDATDLFEKYKDQLRHAIHLFKTQLDSMGSSAEQQVQELKTKLDQVVAQLNLGKASENEAFKAQREKIEAALHEVYATGKSLYSKHFDEILDLFDNSSTAFKTGLEILQLQFSLGKMNSRDELEAVKKSMNEKLNELSQWYAKTTEESLKSFATWGKLAKENLEKIHSWAETFSKTFKQ